MGFSISACTRDKRGRDEENGQDYYFLTPDDFKEKIDKKEFIEWQEVYRGAFYGTLKSEVDRLWSEGKHVLFDVDVKGGLNLKKYFGDDALAVFVQPPSLEVLEQRLRNRATDDEDSISRRLFKVSFEMGFKDQFDTILINDTLEDSFKKAQTLIDNFTK